MDEIRKQWERTARESTRAKLKLADVLLQALDDDTRALAYHFDLGPHTKALIEEGNTLIDEQKQILGRLPNVNKDIWQGYVLGFLRGQQGRP